MKKLLALIALLFCTSTFAQWATVAPGLVANQPVGTSGLGRPDAQIEANNITNPTGHAMISIFQTRNPGIADNEGALDFEAYDSTGVRRQFGAISYMWVDPNPATGYAVARHEVNTVLGSGEVPLRLFGAQKGAVFFGANGTLGDHSPAGGPFVRIDRAAGFPSLAGLNDLVLEGKYPGAGYIFLNWYGGAAVYLGGELRLSINASSGGCPASVPAGVSRCWRIVSGDGQYSYIPEYR